MMKMTKNYMWQIHINEGFGWEGKAPDVEAALLQAFAVYWKEHPKPSIIMFDIQVLNLTLHNASEKPKKRYVKAKYGSNLGHRLKGTDLHK